MKYVILRTGGKQYRVSEGQLLEIEKIDKQPKDKVEFNEVLLVVDGEERILGQPQVEKAKVVAEVLEQIRGPKIRVAKFKAKVRYHRVRGHRQSLTRIKIEKIASGKETEVKLEHKPAKRPVRKTAKSSPKKLKSYTTLL